MQSSRYAELAGIPLSYLGVVTYALLLASAAVPGFPGRLLAVVMGAGGVLFSFWLLYAELFLIRAICPWCMVSLAVMILSLAVAIGRIMTAGDLSSGST